jgi:hypothetical protein
MGRKTGRPGIYFIVAAIGALAVLAAAAPASASTQVKIREVSPGITDYTTNAEFIELQAIADGQAAVGGKVIRFYSPTGTQTDTLTLPADVANGGSQRTILIGTSDVAADFGVPPDFIYPGPNLENGGGAVCYGALDCVSWGSFTGTPSSPAGTAAPAIPEGQSAVRTIARGCVSALDTADDTDDSNADFAVTTSPTPRNNATAPTETVCGGNGGDDVTPPDTTITKAPRKAVKTKKRKAKVTFGFRSSEGNSTFECRVDGGAWKSCSSPHTIKVKRGKHTFEVAATDRAGNPDATPASHTFKVKKKRKKKR